MLNIAAKLSKFGVYASTQALSCRTVVVQVQGWVMFCPHSKTWNETSLWDFLSTLIAFVTIIPFDLLIENKLTKGDDEYWSNPDGFYVIKVM